MAPCAFAHGLALKHVQGPFTGLRGVYGVRLATDLEVDVHSVRTLCASLMQFYIATPVGVSEGRYFLCKNFPWIIIRAALKNVTNGVTTSWY